MQVFLWLFKVTQDQQQADLSKLHNKATNNKAIKESSKEIIPYTQRRVTTKAKKPEETSLDCKNFKYIALLLRKESSTTSFSSTLHRKILSGLNQRQQEQHYILSMKMNKNLIRSLGKNHSKGDSISAHVGNKVLPISDSTSSSSSSSVDKQKHIGPSDQKKDGSNRGDINRNKTLSRMKELLRWANAAKSEKRGKFGRKVLHLKNKAETIKPGGIDGELSNESPKISLKWEVVESCTTICPADLDPPSINCGEYCHRTGNWITTDDEFVVLEL